MFLQTTFFQVDQNHQKDSLNENVEDRLLEGSK